MNFTELISNIAILITTFRGFWENCAHAGISPDDWFEGQAKTLVNRYRELREAGTHEFASWELRIESRKLRASLREVNLPGDMSALKVVYQKELLAYRANILSCELISDPDQAMTFINNFQMNAVSTVAFKNLDEILELTYLDIQERLKNKMMLVKILGWEMLSEAIGGFNPSRLGILLADTGFGKTNLALNLCLAAQKTMAVAYANMEMSYEDMGKRVIAATFETSLADMYKGKIPDPLKALEAVRHNYFAMTSGRDLTVHEISTFLRQVKKEKNIKFAVIDYDQKLELKLDKNTPEWKALQTAIIALESIAKELEIYVLVLAQTNEEGAISGSRRSMYPAATVISFYEDENEGVVAVAKYKNRFGPIGEGVRINYRPEMSMCKEVERINLKKVKNVRRTLAG